MKIISKKETLKSTIPLMSLFVGLNALIIALSTYFNIISFLLLVFLPLISTIYSLNTKKKYFLIYLLCSIFLSSLITFNDLSLVFLNLIPSLIQGLVFSIIIEKNKDGTIAYMCSIFIMYVFYIIFIPILNLIYDINILKTIIDLLGFTSYQNELNLIIYGLLFLSCSLEIFIVCIITKGEIKKFGYELSFFKNLSIFILIGTLISSSATIIFYFLKLYQISYTFLAISFIYSLILTIQLIKNKPLIFLPLTILFLIIDWVLYILFSKNNNYFININYFSIFGIIRSGVGIAWYFYLMKKGGVIK